MGLSDEERWKKIMFAAKNMNEHTRNLKKCLKSGEYVFTETKVIIQGVIKCVESLWYRILGRQSNSVYWLLGGSLNERVTEANKDPWAVAICHQLYEHRPKENQEFMDEVNKSWEADPFNLNLRIQDFLQGWELCIYKIYAETEFMSYALRRYNDKFRKELSSLDDAVSRIQGHCFELFAREEGEVFAKAYLAHELAKIVYDKDARGAPSAYVEALGEISLTYALLGGLRRKNLKEMIDLHRSWLEGEQTDQDRVLLGLAIAGRSYRYPLEHKKLLELLVPLGFSKKKLKKACKKCITEYERHKEEEKKEKERWPDNDSDVAIHGYGVWDILKNKKEKKGVP